MNDHNTQIANIKTTLSDVNRCHSLGIDPAWYGVERDLVGALTSLEELVAERDALKAQLDSMTEEWGTSYELFHRGRGYSICKSEEDARTEATHRNELLVKRFVFPWTSAAPEPEGDNQ